MLFQGNLRKIFQQIGVNLEKNCNFGLIWAVSGPRGSPTLHIYMYIFFFSAGNFKV